jgi:hypothetical protein
LAPKPFTLAKPFARRNVSAAAGKQPSWKLDTPNRLWELDEIWYPGGNPPEYLDGSLPGDRGFDPLRLFSTPELRPWLVEGELYNGRVAMMAAAGILFTEAVGLGPWWTAPARGVYPLPFATGVVVSHAIMAVFEYKRITNFQKYGETGFLNSVPFDPLNLRSDKTRQNEVRNGRLAMLANLGFWSQAANTGKGPLENLRDHIADPTHNNIYTSKVGLEATLAAIFIGIVPIVIEVRKDLTPKDRLDDEGIRPFPFL